MSSKITRVYVYQWSKHVNVFIERNDDKESRLYSHVSIASYRRLRKALGYTNVKPSAEVSPITTLVRISWTLV